MYNSLSLVFTQRLDAEKISNAEREGKLNNSPLYVWTVGEGATEHVVYVGIRSSSRFSGGHPAALRLLDPIYKNLRKSVYFASWSDMIVSKHDGDPVDLESCPNRMDIVDVAETMLISDWKLDPPKGAAAAPIGLFNIRKTKYHEDALLMVSVSFPTNFCEGIHSFVVGGVFFLTENWSYGEQPKFCSR